MSGAHEAADDVLVDPRGRCALITLHRPAALNALTHAMVRRIASALAELDADPAVGTIVLRGDGDRAFCAGGDVVALARAARAEPGAAVEFWRDEYALNLALATARTPVVSLMHGVTLGGGIGLGAHVRHRVVTPDSALGMPEVTIGFVPDVGGTRLLARAPGELGTHLALTGAPVGAADAIAVGLADLLVPTERLDELVTSLESVPVDAALAAVAEPPGPSALAADRGRLDRAYAGDSVPRILDALDAEGLGEVADRIRTKSPTALAVTLASLRAARGEHSLAAALERELRVSTRMLAEPDFAEGVRAQLIDKDRTPRWTPATLAEVDPAHVAAILAP